MNVDEKALLDRVFSGSEQGFADLLERYRPLFYSVFAQPGFGFPRDYLDDVFQSFVLALRGGEFRKLRAFEGRNESSLATFLQVVATRFALDERRKFRRHPRGWGEAGRDDDETSPEFVDTSETDPAAPALDREKVDLFHNMLFSLDWKRVSAVLWVFHDVTREQIAEVMSTSRANIDALYKRAKDQMAALYAAGDYSARPREPDPEVLTPPVSEALRSLLLVPPKAAREALLQPDAKRRALLGLVLLEYPRYQCTRGELVRLAKIEDVESACLEVLGEVAERVKLVGNRRGRGHEARQDGA